MCRAGWQLCGLRDRYLAELQFAGFVFLTPLLAAGDPLDSGAAAVALDQLRSVIVEAAARWSATG